MSFSFNFILKGAGFHSVAKTGAYRNLCETICAEVYTHLRKGMEARKAVAYAIELLEVNLDPNLVY